MPGFDGTGPWGAGPRTGGGFGFCPPIYGARPFRFGVGRGGYPWGGGRGRAWGGGRGWAWRTYAPAPHAFPYAVWRWGYPGAVRPNVSSAADELSVLEQQAEGLEQELRSIRERIDELKARGRQTEEKGGR